MLSIAIEGYSDFVYVLNGPGLLNEHVLKSIVVNNDS